MEVIKVINKFYSHTTAIKTGYGNFFKSHLLSYGWRVTNYERHEDRLIIQYTPFFNFMIGLVGVLPLFVINFEFFGTPGLVSAATPILITLYHETKI